MSKFKPPAGNPPAVQYFRPEELAVDASYQRSTKSHGSQRLIQQIAENWDWRLCTPLLVASRDARLYIIDGQHRWEAARLRGDIPHLPCAVGNYTGSAEEAALFVAANRHRVRVNPIDMWRAAVASGDTPTVTLEQLVGAARLRIASSPQPSQLQAGELLCTRTLYRALRIFGGDKVGSALILIGGAFADQVIHHSGLLFGAVLGFFNGAVELDVDQLEEALGAMSADEWTTHPALAGVVGAPGRTAKLREVILEVASLCEEAA